MYAESFHAIKNFALITCTNSFWKARYLGMVSNALGTFNKAREDSFFFLVTVTPHQGVEDEMCYKLQIFWFQNRKSDSVFYECFLSKTYQKELRFEKFWTKFGGHG